MVLVYPAFFAQSRPSMPQSPHEKTALRDATWIILGLDATVAYAHSRDLVVQSVLVALSLAVLSLVTFLFAWMSQKYHMASASIAHLEKIKQHLVKFVPITVQRLIEDNPDTPLLSKVVRDATVLFLDIEHYTYMAADMSPEALNRLIEHYFAAFLDIILSHGGEINETTGDGIMAIFTGKSLRAHALNAVKAAIMIREQTCLLNQQHALHEPDILVNIGMNTGQVLLGATMIQGTEGERFTYTASGIVTNIASRLCDLGTNGDIHLSETTAHLVQDRVTLHGPHETHLKNVRGTMPVYKLESAPRERVGHHQR